MSISYQSMLGLSDVNTDVFATNTLVANNATIKNLTLPTGAEKGYVLTSDDIGQCKWTAIPEIVLGGDAVGAPGSNVVNTLAGGTIPVLTLVQLDAPQTLTAKTLITPTISSILNTGTLTLPVSTDTLVGRGTVDTLTNKTLIQPIINSIYNGGIVTIPTGTDTLVSLLAVQTLRNKTLLAPKITSIVNDGISVLNVPSAADTLVARATVDTLTNKTLIQPVISSISNGGIVTVPSGTDTLVTLTALQTLTKKTLVAPVIATIVNGGTFSLPGTLASDTLVGRNTVDVLTNKTLTLPVISSISNGGTVTIPAGTDTLVTLTAAQTLVNKTLTLPTISSIVNIGTLTLPTASDTLVGRATMDTLTNKTLTFPVISTISNGGTVTIPAGTDTLATLTAVQTLTNKTLISPFISTIRNGAFFTLTLPSVTDTLVGKLTTDTLTNKTLTMPIISSISNGGTVTIPAGTDTLVNLTGTQTLANKTLSLPNISSIVNTGTLTLPTSSDTLVGRATADNLTNKILTGSTNTIDANNLRFSSTVVVPLSGAAPATNNVLTYNGTNAVWQVPTASTSVTMGGDITGNSGASVVSKINGTAIAGAAVAATANTLALRDSTGSSSFAGLTTSAVLLSKNVIHCNNQLNNKMVCLYDGDNTPGVTSGTNFHGFGVNSQTSRYQAPPNCTHRFFVSTAEIANIGPGGMIATNLTCNGLLTSKTVMSCNSQIQNKMISLYDNDGTPTVQNGTNFHGFGINDRTSRYQAPANCYHRFYVGTAEVANFSTSGMDVNVNMNINGVVYMGGALILPTPGGIPTYLDYYEEYQYTTTFTGFGVTTGSISIRIIRIGKNVTLSVDGGSFNPASLAVRFMAANTPPPTRFQPGGGRSNLVSMIMQQNAIYLPSFSVISNNSLVFQNCDPTFFQQSWNTIAWYGYSMTYNIN